MIEFEYTLERSSRRRTLSIQIDRGRVVVKAPLFVSEADLQQWVLSKQAWVTPRLVQQQKALSKHSIDLHSDTLVVNGINYQLEKVSQLTPEEKTICHTGRCVRVKVNARSTDQSIRRQLQSSLKGAAQQQLIARSEQLSSFTGLKPSSVNIGSYTSKWGQCSSRGEISLNWRLIHLSHTLQDYVIIHELCHLKEMNHSPRFWALVSRFFPEYQLAKQEIKDRFAYLKW
ncbi:MAG: M48 family metallopeptidase [Marinobacterium sp.]